ncbi:uncharacterized protein LOC121899421 isoform X2 [Thunnus maccoyii]|uniref:uncharacterized protein LOC121899421 isoform X2 n=1 Tax=Thunnus maccoyii TaxID=8240 RepID=UPI001C4CEDBB|nr:uncharacterized protein LOC121899421 isoform X2 [Thunnus maccoyii]
MAYKLLNLLCILSLTQKIMSDSENDLFMEDPDPGIDILPETTSTSSGGQRRSACLALRGESSMLESDLLSQLRECGISPAPGLPLSQLNSPTPGRVDSARAGPTPAPAPGRKRTRNKEIRPISSPPAEEKAKSLLSLFYTSPFSSRSLHPCDPLLTTLQSLVNSIQSINARLLPGKRLNRRPSVSNHHHNSSRHAAAGLAQPAIHILSARSRPTHPGLSHPSPGSRPSGASAPKQAKSLSKFPLFKSRPHAHILSVSQGSYEERSSCIHT